MSKKSIVKLTANFGRNLADVERFLAQADAPQAVDALLDELLDTVIPNLERFPDIGRPFLARATRSVETSNALIALRAKLSPLTTDPEALREYILGDYLVLYVRIEGLLYLLAIRHYRQISFDFASHWGEL
ncbi:MAG: type II toxin-antitoxin system RelE/ParE family toxin [Pseudomonadota bacterium]|nr:type II toxin-antitoxin system RelE/ParE family toxin [Pseudomonadota bacterium]